MMIFWMILWNMLSVHDLCYYQHIHYQKDRYMSMMDLPLKNFVLMVCFSILVFILEIYDLGILYSLVMLMILPSVLKKMKCEMKQLVITKRIMRLIVVMILVDMITMGLFSLVFDVLRQIFMLFILFFHSFVFYLFIWITHPIEMKIRHDYVQKAKVKCDAFEGIKIGITGSYGKTSIKNLVYDVLSMKYLCLKTKASYNNQMGITKTILEEMEHQEIFICEMGADHLHEIEDLCSFVSPTIGIVSAVGPQHLATFKTMDNILNEKMKLLEALPKEGMGFFNFDNFYLHTMDMQLDCEVMRIGIHSQAQLQAVNMKCDHLGSQFDVKIDEKILHFTTSLLGEHNILNCLFAIALGRYLKVDDVLIQMAIACAKPIEHRLELKPFYKGMCMDNAYNSNPESAKASLDVLKLMPKRHLLITPGFLDLGKLQEYYSIEFGKQMAFCDKIILIGPCEDIRKGLIEAAYHMDNVTHVQTMQEALTLMSVMIEEGDTMLIENDIPSVLMNTSKKKA